MTTSVNTVLEVIPHLRRRDPRRVHLGDGAIIRHVGAPLPLRLERNRRFGDVEPRGIGGCLGAARLAPGMIHFGKCPEDGVLLPHDLASAGHGYSGQSRWHEEDRSLLERWHEFAADPRPWHACGNERYDASHDHWFAVGEDTLITG